MGAGLQQSPPSTSQPDPARPAGSGPNPSPLQSRVPLSQGLLGTALERHRGGTQSPGIGTDGSLGIGHRRFCGLLHHPGSTGRQDQGRRVTSTPGLAEEPPWPCCGCAPCPAPLLMCRSSSWGIRYLQAQGCHLHHLQGSAIGTEQVPGFVVGADLERGGCIRQGQEKGAAGIPCSPGACSGLGHAQVRAEKGWFRGNSQIFQSWHQERAQSWEHPSSVWNQVPGSIPEPRGRTQPRGRTWHHSCASQGHTRGTFRPQ